MGGQLTADRIESRSEACSFLGPGPQPIPPELVEAFYPAVGCVREWRTYWLLCPGADELRIGDNRVQQVTDGLFPIRFENRLGLAALQPFAGSDPVGAPFVLEVISHKFADLEQYRRFYSALLDELFSSAARLPFAFHGPTARGAGEATAPATPLFTYHFLRHFGHRLHGVLEEVRAHPHRDLDSRLTLTPLALAGHIDADVLLGIARDFDEWQSSGASPLSDRLGGMAPARVLQRQPYEVTDTPLNRFAAAFIDDLLSAARFLPAQPWWRSIPAKDRDLILDATGFLQGMAGSAPFADAGPLELLPAEGLIRREGYRELLYLWQLFQTARQPLFGRLQQALEVRDIATLYEIWVFFRLVEEIGSLVGLPADGKDLDLKLSDETGLGWRAVARFGTAGTLIYNLDFASGASVDASGRGVGGSYSVPLRPDFTWVVDGRPEVVLDAKFRMDRPPNPDDGPEGASGSARAEDLYKMHAYRDALGVRAAVVLYPGDNALFYHQDGKTDRSLRVDRVLREPFRGVGAIPLRPQTTAYVIG